MPIVDFSLKNKIAIVTGGSRGIGEAIAKGFAEYGATVIVCSRKQDSVDRVAAEINAAGGKALGIACHAGQSAAIEALFARVKQEFGRVDVLVNNAGVAVAGGIDVVSADDWRWIVDINLLGVVWGCRAAVPAMRRQGHGLILSIASSAGFASAPQMGPYNATKAAVISLSETLAAELDTAGIQVSCAMPGFFRTHLLDTMRAPSEENAMAHQLMDHSGHDPTEAAQAILAAVAKGRLYIVWPREYRLLWALKRWFPTWFLGRVRGFRDTQIRRGARRPPG